MIRFLLAVFVLVAFPAPIPAQDAVKENYTKYEYMVPMRDGVKLYAAVYVPKDDSRTYPIMLMRTPYGVGPYGAHHYPSALGPSAAFQKAGYIFVDQDVRGRMASEGQFTHARPHNPTKQSKETDESSDTFDTIEWLVKNVKGNNGKAGQWGISYPGFYTSHGMIDSHPALKASSPQAPVTDLFDGDDCRHNGAFLLAHNFGFMEFFPRMRPNMYRRPGTFATDRDTQDGYKFFLEMGPLKNADAKYLKGVEPFWNDLMMHHTYDAYSRERDLRPHLKKVKPAVLTVGGWFDAEDLAGALNTFRSVDGAPPAGGNHLVMGPWSHGGWNGGDGDRHGDVRFHSKTAEFYRDKVEFPFFEYHLKGKGEGNFPKARVFETGTNRWRTFGAWPPKEAEGRVYCLEADGGLSDAVIQEAFGEPRSTFDEFVSDPAKPVPYINKTVFGMDGGYMTADQRFASQRPDVLVYQTPVLKEDVTVAGPIEVELHVSTTGTDADWVVKLIDVYPDDFPDLSPNPTGVRMGGYQQLVRGEPFRGKFRNSFEKPEPFKPGEVAKVKFTMPDVLHTFRSGHRVMVQVQSSWFPLIDRNPQTFCDINKAGEKDFVKQTHRVHRDDKHPSRVTVRVLK